MAKNRNNKFKGSSKGNASNCGGRNNADNANQSQSCRSMKDTHSQTPDNSPDRSGPGGE